MDYFYRKIDSALLGWKDSAEHKPLLLRGARQVGKSSSIRHLAESFDNFIEINFEANPEVCAIFESTQNPKEICSKLEILYGKKIVPQKTLLFFDEIQECPEAITSLRFFYENYPELHVIAAGSLLEFALSDLPTFGVGRVLSLFLMPFSFEEFLYATENKALSEEIQRANPEKTLLPVFHEKALELYKTFLIIGGLPESIKKYVQTKSVLQSTEVLDELFTSYNTDFEKYKKRIPSSRIREVFLSVCHQTGGKFVFAQNNSGLSYRQTTEALDLLQMAGLIYPVKCTRANGLPLGAEINEKQTKYIPFDTGIFLTATGLDIRELPITNDFDVVNKGFLAEISVGLELLKETSFRKFPEIFYWKREVKSSNAEIDYIIVKDGKIIPIEVKAGTKGSMKSMQLFLESKSENSYVADFGYRLSLENFCKYSNIKVAPVYSAGK